MDNSPDIILSAARLLAVVINPIFVLLLLVSPLHDPRRQPRAEPALSAASSARAYGKWIAFCVLGVAIPVVIAEYSKRRQLWGGHAGFPSGHETFATSAATCLVIGSPRRMPIALVLTGVMAWSLVRAGYHDVSDTLGALVLGPVGAGAVALVMGKRRMGKRRLDGADGSLTSETPLREFRVQRSETPGDEQ